MYFPSLCELFKKNKYYIIFFLETLLFLTNFLYDCLYHFLFFLQYLSTFLSILYIFRCFICVSLLGILHICSILYSCGVWQLALLLLVPWEPSPMLEGMGRSHFYNSNSGKLLSSVSGFPENSSQLLWVLTYRPTCGLVLLLHLCGHVTHLRVIFFSPHSKNFFIIQHAILFTDFCYTLFVYSY